MNKNLPKKLAVKAAKVSTIKAEQPALNAFALGGESYKRLKGSYGVTLNPFTEFSRSHAEFRDGFKSTRKLLRA